MAVRHMDFRSLATCLDTVGITRQDREKSVSLMELMLKARIVRVGSFHGAPIEPIVVSRNVLSFFIEGTTGSHKFCIKPHEIRQCLASFSNDSSHVFFLTTHQCGKRTRQDLGIANWVNHTLPPPEPFFDPVSPNMLHQMISVSLDTLEEDTKRDFMNYIDIFKNWGNMGNEGFFVELSPEEAEEILRSTTRKSVPTLEESETSAGHGWQTLSRFRIDTSGAGQGQYNNSNIYHHLIAQNNTGEVQDVIMAGRRPHILSHNQCKYQPGHPHGMRVMGGQQVPPTSSVSTNQNWSLISNPLQNINKSKVILEGGGQSEEGQAYSIRDKHRNSHKMHWKNGEFVPFSEPEKSRRSMGPEPVGGQMSGNQMGAQPMMNQMGGNMPSTQMPDQPMGNPNFVPSQLHQLKAQITAYKLLLRNQPLSEQLRISLEGKRTFQPQMSRPQSGQQVPPTSSVSSPNPVQVLSMLTNQNQSLISSPLQNIKKRKMTLEGGEQFEEGQAYSIQDKHGNSHKMHWKNGEFVPFSEPEKSTCGQIHIGVRKSEATRLLHPSVGKQPDGSAAFYKTRVAEQDKKLADMEQKMLCVVCMERERNMAFSCGHTICSVCGDTLTVCHLCRKSVDQKIKLFLN